jgi:hypothetical protein
MTRREQKQEIELAGKLFQIEKFSPETACYWATRLMGDFFAATQAGGDFLKKIPEIIQNFTRLDKDMHKAWQLDCLSAVKVKYDSGFHPFIGLDGNYADVPAPVVLNLTIRSFMFSISDFFDPAQISGLMGAVTQQDQPGTSPPTSTETVAPKQSFVNFSTPQSP